MSEPIDLSAEQVKQVAMKVRVLLDLFTPPINDEGKIAGPHPVNQAIATAWGWQLQPTGSSSDEDPDVKPSPGILPSGIRGKGGHGDPTGNAVLSSLGSRDGKDLTYKIICEHLDGLGQSIDVFVKDITGNLPLKGNAQLRRERDPQPSEQFRKCATRVCLRAARDNKRHCGACAKYLSDHNCENVPPETVRKREEKAEQRRIRVDGPLAETA